MSSITRNAGSRTTLDRLVLGLAATAWLVSACGASSTTTGPSTAPTGAVVSATPPSLAPTVVPSAAPSPVASEVPASAQIAFTGDTGLTAPTIGPGGVDCSEPSLDGLIIAIFAQPADAAQLYRITIGPGTFNARLATGSGPAYRERDFSGTGVTGFDAAHGVTIDTTLTETTPPTTNKGKLGAVTAVKGKVDCGTQAPGTATISLTGTTPAGAYSGTLDPVRVRCLTDAQGGGVSVVALGTLGTAPVFVIVTLHPNGFTVFVSPRSGATYFYTATGTTFTTFTAGSAHIDGDAAQAGVTGTPPTIHASGDAVCGS